MKWSWGKLEQDGDRLPSAVVANLFSRRGLCLPPSTDIALVHHGTARQWLSLNALWAIESFIKPATGKHRDPTSPRPLSFVII